MELPPLFRERAEFSEAKLAEFREAVSQGVPELAGFPQLCIYTTGSFGRREAGRHSDIDLFFVTEGDPGCIPKLKKTLIDADLIRVGKRLGYPEFSRDGLYLKPHSIRSLSEKIGHQDEDAENSFTARLLLLLESAPIYNEGVYHRAIGACVGQYYRDYAKHISDFNPIFLANDIMRYWKTLCLNYEYARVNIKDEDKPNIGSIIIN